MWNWIGINANPLLVLVGVAGVIVACITLWKLREQAEIGRKAAEAALLNARALINSERPWIMVKVERSKRSKNAYDVVAVNKGRTPAAVISHAENCILVRPPESPPDVAEYNKPSLYEPPRIVLPEEFCCPASDQ